MISVEEAIKEATRMADHFTLPIMSEVVTLLRELVGYDTHNPGGDEGALAMRIAELLAKHAPDELVVEEVPRSDLTGAWLLARWGRPRLLVNAHLDTVPPNAGWTQPPYALTVENGHARGLGACDTKGAIAAILSALDEARPRDVAILFSGDEEHTGTCMRDFVRRGRHAGVTQAIVCEPTSLRAGTRHRGILGLELTLRGAGGHSSRADQLPAPIAELARLAVAYHEWGRERRAQGPGGFAGMCMNVAQLDGGVAFNVVPEKATLTVSVRPPPGADVAAVRAELVQLAERMLPGVQVHVPVENPPFRTREAAAFRPFLGSLVEAPVDLAFWTEAAVLSQAGVDCVVIGPGDIARAHAPDEEVPLDELERARALFVNVFHESQKERTP